MLNPNHDRLDYGEILSAPAGYVLDFAVGTTYSLDPDALVGACLALGLSHETDSTLRNNPICLLEALRSTGDKIALFCQGGQIQFPANATALYVLLEKIVYEVVPEKGNKKDGYPSFHPKFWLIRYINGDKNPLYRVVVLSRNLTFDRSWDITFTMDGTIKKETTDKNAPVIDFLKYLSNYAGDKQVAIKKLIHELPHVCFSLDSKEFHDFEFLPIGIKGKYRFDRDPLFTESYREVLIMSPFLTGSVIRSFQDRRPKNALDYILITRAMSLPKLKPEDCKDFSVYTLKDAIVDGESIISEENSDFHGQDIHAKLYVVCKGYDTDLYLGSLNASHMGIYRNIEFMIRLKSKKRFLDLSTITNSLFCTADGDKGNPFQQVSIDSQQAEPPRDEKTALLEAVLKDFLHTKHSATVQSGGENYEIHMHLQPLETKCSIQLCPFLSHDGKEYAEDMVFTEIPLTELSEFYKIQVSYGDHRICRLIKIPTTGIPEDREKAIVSSMVKYEWAFYQYIAFLLGDNHVFSAMEEAFGHNTSRQNGTSPKKLFSPLYEKLLRTAYEAPEKLKGIDYLLKRISQDQAVPKGFLQMYETLRKVVKVDD